MLKKNFVILMGFIFKCITPVPLFSPVSSLNWPSGKALKPAVLTDVIVPPNTEVKGRPQ